ncbi:MAG TPA: group 1 truncated hemoglobin [Geminicoccus sp.]|jgi:hemoglobin|uniref:truncated hemoglobin n=1 Tax=Geminicoccus sp. TaxID=2024832 RepID=UPI002E3754F5|nr:group 1 truncated hemoglobin [Geminicoccus sp.]HEX2524787.1 group 1 truncated hemoglobin [Geminicoccus sp.]
MLTLFERIGGFVKVRHIVSAFYDRVLGSSLGRYFEHTDMRTLIDHQTKFISSVMGGPVSISDSALKRAHERLGITKEDFDQVVGLLEETLKDFDVPPVDLEQVLAEVRRRQHLIVTRG